MNSSLWSVDYITHIKIVAVSLALTAFVVVIMGTNFRSTDSSINSAKDFIDRRPVVAGQPINLSATESSTIR